MKIIIIEKTGNCKELKLKKKLLLKDLYKKCKLRKDNDFSKRATWGINGEFYISIYAKDNGRSGSENKKDLPCPIDEKLYFGSIAVICHSEKEANDDNLLDLDMKKWEKFYDKAMGGSESLGEEDTEEEDELKNYPKENLTKEGYLMDGFVVKDGEEEDDDDDEEEEEYIEEQEGSDNEEEQEEDDDEDCYGKDSDLEDEDEEYEDEDEEYEDEDDDEEDEITSELDEEEYHYKN
tara:strand:+ start:1850 stop:2554 length:705 start_codon:yes stop_codon:yes gene_type:complete